MSSKKSVMIMDRGEYTTCTVNLHGGVISSWRVSNKEQLFVSRKAKYNDLTFIRGGIAVIFPIAYGWKFGPENGIARLMQWTVEKPPKKIKGKDDIEATISLEDNEYSKSMWNYKFKIVNKITLRAKELEFEITVKNTDKHFPFTFDVVLQTHVKVPDVTKCDLSDLTGCEYRKIPFVNREKFVHTQDFLYITEYISRCYGDAPDEVFVTHAMQDQIINVRKRNFPDLVVWNPWDKQSSILETFDPDEYMKMICIGAARLNDPVRLKPDEKFEGTLTLEICTPEYCQFILLDTIIVKKLNKTNT